MGTFMSRCLVAWDCSAKSQGIRGFASYRLDTAGYPDSISSRAAPPPGCQHLTSRAFLLVELDVCLFGLRRADTNSASSAPPRFYLLRATSWRVAVCLTQNRKAARISKLSKPDREPRSQTSKSHRMFGCLGALAKRKHLGIRGASQVVQFADSS